VIRFERQKLAVAAIFELYEGSHERGEHRPPSVDRPIHATGAPPGRKAPKPMF
jgi:hypothetical protein